MQDWNGLESGRRRAVLGRWAALLFGIVPVPGTLSPDALAALRQDEIQAQAAAILRERPIRLVVIALVLAVFVLYLDWRVAAGAAVMVLLADALEGPARRLALSRPNLRWLPLATVYVGEVFFCLPASLVWHMPDAFTKAVSVGVFAAAMMRLATIRSIHPATGFAGTAALASLIAVSNSTYWIMADNWPGLAFTTVIAAVSTSYVVAAIIQNHNQQRMAALSQMAAVRASEAKSLFLSQMSHELRTPLNGIIGTGTAAFLTTQEAGVKEQLAVLLKSAEGLAVVLNDVLDMSAVEEGRITLRPRLGDLRDEVGQTVALFRAQADAAGLGLRLEVQDALPVTILLDFDRLRQCLSNLVSNALKHTERGGVVVHVSFEPPDQVRIEVQDSGIGIPKGAEERIFGRFERGGSTRDGHGLGLAICRTVAGRMGGEVGLVPTEVGARFFLRVPVEVVEAEAELPVSSPAVTDVAGARVMVVDDIATNRLVAATYLGLLGCIPIEVSAGAEAVERLRQSAAVDLILMDIYMPDLDGLATLRLIRALPGPAGQVPIVAMTADAVDHDRQGYLAEGLDGHVTKPIHLNTLRTEIARVLAARPKARD